MAQTSVNRINKKKINNNNNTAFRPEAVTASFSNFPRNNAAQNSATFRFPADSNLSLLHKSHNRQRFSLIDHEIIYQGLWINPIAVSSFQADFVISVRDVH